MGVTATVLDLLITNGSVVTAQATAAHDVGIKDGRVVLLAAPGAVETDAKRVVDASGHYLVPGGVDSHVHFNWGVGALKAQSSISGSLAAAYGGTTTFIDFAYQHGDDSIIDAVEAKRRELADDHPHVDYALHAMVTGDVPTNVLAQLPEVIQDGVTSVKMFTTLPMVADDGCIWEAMRFTGSAGGLVMVHCEDSCIIARSVADLERRHMTEGRNIHLARPNLAEEAAISRMIVLSRRSEVPLYVVHVSTHEGVEALTTARRRGQLVYGEALHNQLAFSAEDYARPDGLLYHNFPPLKSVGDRSSLWTGIVDGGLDAVSSDEFTVSRAVKMMGKTVNDISGGHNGIETRMLYAYSEGVAAGRMSINRFVDVTSTTPAKLFGLHPRKGVIAPGSDADIVLIDPSATTKMTLADMHADCDYSLWDGWSFTGRLRMTILRGEILVEDGAWVGPERSGQYLKSNLPEAS